MTSPDPFHSSDDTSNQTQFRRNPRNRHQNWSSQEITLRKQAVADTRLLSMS